jgi:hypothetical protein
MLNDSFKYKTLWTIRRYADDASFSEDVPYEVSEVEGNLLLNEGIGEVLDIICGLGSPTVYSNANAQLGVGDSNAAESASQTDLQASTNKTWKAMESGYPTRTSQTVTFRSVFGSSDANYTWAEFSIRNGASADKNLNRKVSAQGTKASGQTWTVDLAITLS